MKVEMLLFGGAIFGGGTLMEQAEYSVWYEWAKKHMNVE